MEFFLKITKINRYNKKEIVCTWCFLSKRYWANLFYIPLVDILTFPRKIGHKEKYLPNISKPLDQNNNKKSFGEIILYKYYCMYREQPWKTPTKRWEEVNTCLNTKIFQSKKQLFLYISFLKSCLALVFLFLNLKSKS